MGIIQDVLKEIPTDAVLREKISAVEKHVIELEQQNKELRAQNDALIKRISELDPPQDFEIVDDMLWKKNDSGFDKHPYCRTCRRIMTSFPPVGVAMYWICSKCNRDYPYRKAPNVD